MGFFDLAEEPEKSFLCVVRHTVLEGPITLVRFSCSTVREAGAYGKYWMYGSEVTEALQKKQGDRLIRDIRHWWAISNDWGGFTKYLGSPSSSGKTAQRVLGICQVSTARLY